MRHTSGLTLLFVFAMAFSPVNLFAVDHKITLLPASSVWLIGDSTLHPFTCRSTQVQITGTVASDVSAAPPAVTFDAMVHKGALKSLDVDVPVTSLKSKESSLDKNMYKDLKADQCPDIRFHLTAYQIMTSTDGNPNANASGVLTIGCQSRDVTLDAQLNPDAQTLHIQGVYHLLMTDYGIKPRTMMMGAIKVKPPVEIHYDLQLGVVE